MRLAFVAVEQNKHDWLLEFTEEYKKKIQGFVPFEVVFVKSAKFGRDEKEKKLKAETQEILRRLDPQDFVILWDERGIEQDSLQFSKKLKTHLESGRRRIVFVLGGAYGFGEELRQRGNESWSLSKLTLSHPVAQMTALEQIYRALTIWKGIPYHNQ